MNNRPVRRPSRADTESVRLIISIQSIKLFSLLLILLHIVRIITQNLLRSRQRRLEAQRGGRQATTTALSLITLSRSLSSVRGLLCIHAAGHGAPQLRPLEEVLGSAPLETGLLGPVRGLQPVQHVQVAEADVERHRERQDFRVRRAPIRCVYAQAVVSSHLHTASTHRIPNQYCFTHPCMGTGRATTAATGRCRSLQRGGGRSCRCGSSPMRSGSCTPPSSSRRSSTSCSDCTIPDLDARPLPLVALPPEACVDTQSPYCSSRCDAAVAVKRHGRAPAFLALAPRATTTPHRSRARSRKAAAMGLCRAESVSQENAAVE